MHVFRKLAKSSAFEVKTLINLVFLCMPEPQTLISRDAFPLFQIPER